MDAQVTRTLAEKPTRIGPVLGMAEIVGTPSRYCSQSEVSQQLISTITIKATKCKLTKPGTRISNTLRETTRAEWVIKTAALTQFIETLTTFSVKTLASCLRLLEEMVTSKLQGSTAMVPEVTSLATEPPM